MQNKSVEWVDVNSIKPDINQPRTVFKEEIIQKMAESIKVEGVINPVEIDPQNIIITGEQRWRAAILAGYSKVPVIINKDSLTEFTRFRRQVIENEHHSDMTPEDKARAYKKLLEMKGYKVSGEGLASQGVDNGLRWLAREIGSTKDTIRMYLNVLDKPRFVLEDLRKNPKKMWQYQEAEKLEKKPEIRKRVEEKIAAGDYKASRDVRKEAFLLIRRPDLIEKVLRRKQSQENGDVNAVLNRSLDLILAIDRLNYETLSGEDLIVLYDQLLFVRQKLAPTLGKIKKML
ncbi:MAG: ParB/RepB/Spo0J family partition protein [Nanoarchaeota archaeon]